MNHFSAPPYCHGSFSTTRTEEEEREAERAEAEEKTAERLRPFSEQLFDLMLQRFRPCNECSGHMWTQCGVCGRKGRQAPLVSAWLDITGGKDDPE